MLSIYLKLFFYDYLKFAATNIKIFTNIALEAYGKIYFKCQTLKLWKRKYIPDVLETLSELH